MAEGRQKSASFRGLVDALQQTDVVVYVQPAEWLPGGTEAVTEFVATTGPARYLRIWIGIRAVRKRLIALLGHELQHALEIGRAPEVVDSATLEAFYRRSGDLSVGRLRHAGGARRHGRHGLPRSCGAYQQRREADATAARTPFTARPVNVPRINIAR